jgi:hypothetical protein
MKTSRRRKTCSIGLFVLLLAGLLSPRTWAQDITGSIVGLVKDSNGSAVAGATVTIRSIDKNVVVRTVTTNSNGVYSAPPSSAAGELYAGAELLRVMAEALKWQDKKLWFARLGHLGCLLSYVRLQIGK